MKMSSLFLKCIHAIIVSIVITMSLQANCTVIIYSLQDSMIDEEYRDMPAKFGPVLSSEGMRAYVVVGSPKDGCEPLQPPPGPEEPNFTQNWVVLLARYNCSFEAKVRNAQSAGFNGVIVHNINSSDLEIMSAKNPIGITIPSVFVGYLTGFALENYYPYKDGYFVVINGDLPFNISTHLLIPFAIVVAICLIVIIVVLVVRCVRSRRLARRHRLPYSSLKKIPICKFAKGDPYDTCAICLDDYVEGDKLRVLPCAHAYHCKCIDPWLTKNRRVCPVCKRKVFASGERPNRRNADNSSNSTNSSDSDTDNDRTPLVNSTDRTTQGGTFGTVDNDVFRDRIRTLRESLTQTSSRTNPEAQSSYPPRNQQLSSQRPPFLRGLLRRDRNISPINSNDDETRTLEEVQALIHSLFRPPSVEERPNPERDNAVSTDPSENVSTSNSENSVESNIHIVLNVSNDQGRIGVAALPNIHNTDDINRQNDFIV